MFIPVKILVAQSLFTSLIHGFAPVHQRFIQYNTFSTTTSRSTLLYLTPEELLAKARALRQEAEAQESSLHSELMRNRSRKDAETDQLIQQLFADKDVRNIARRMEEKKISVMMLERVVDRLNEREISARGLDHVEHGHSTGTFQRVRERDERELKAVEGLIQLLIQAADVLDTKVLKERAEKEKKGERTHHHVDSTHWSSGELGKHLKDKAKFLGREHEEQWKKRMEDYYKAAMKKKDQHHSEEQLHW